MINTLKIHDASDTKALYPLLLKKGTWFITHAYDGQDKLIFDIPPNHQMYPRIAEEVRISDDSNRYTVKSIDECASVSTVECELDMDDWRQNLFLQFRTTDQYLSEVLDQIKPDGWSIINSGIVTHRKTVEASEGKPIENATPYDLLPRIAEVYGVVFNYNILERKLTVIDPTTFKSSGKYLMEDLNLKSVKFVGSTKSFATRLYARGKDGLTFEDINDGKNYVEDHSYSDRVISVGWKDERYTIKESLLAAAKAKIKELAYPARSYECTVIDLAKITPEYDFLTLWLYHIVTLVDKRRKTRVDHQVIEYKDYPDAKEKNVVTLSSAAPRIQNTIQKIQVDMQDPNSGFNQGIQGWIDKMAATISGYDGGNMRVTFNADGKPNGLQIMDTDNINTTQKILWLNLKGILYSPNGAEGPFNQVWSFEEGGFVADWIVVGQLRTNLLKAGRIQSQTGAVYLDLDANGGKGELAASILKSVEAGIDTTATIGTGRWSDGSSYQGFRLRYPGGRGGGCLIALDSLSDYLLANLMEFSSLGDIMIRSNTHTDNPGGNNSIHMQGNSSTGEGTVFIARGTKNGSQNILSFFDTYSEVLFNGRGILYGNKDKTEVLYGGNVMRFNDSQLYFYHDKRIEFCTNGYARASIESNGSARFEDIYSNGNLVTSDREKKTNIEPVEMDALREIEGLNFYRYNMLEPDTSFHMATITGYEDDKNHRAKPPMKASDRKVGIGIMYDEAPESVRVESDGLKTIDLYAYINLLAKAVQELRAQVDSLKKEGTN